MSPLTVHVEDCDVPLEEIEHVARTGYSDEPAVVLALYAALRRVTATAEDGEAVIGAFCTLPLAARHHGQLVEAVQRVLAERDAAVAHLRAVLSHDALAPALHLYPDPALADARRWLEEHP